MAVHHVGLLHEPGHHHVALKRVQKLDVPLVLRWHLADRLHAVHAQVAVLLALVVEAEDVDLVGAVVELRQLTGQVFEACGRNLEDVMNVYTYSEAHLAVRGSG